MRRLKGKTAVITGCNRGIGKSILERFVSEGASIIACTRSIPDSLLNYYNELEAKYNVQINPVMLDLSDYQSISACIKTIKGLKKPLDILVNNAGMASFDGIMSLKREKLVETFQVNYFACVQLIQGLTMLLMRSQSPSIINMTSVAGLDATVGNTAYGASKAAVALMTRCIGQELSKLKIRVNAIAPGYINTDMQNDISEDIKNNVMKSIAIRRFGDPIEVADVALFLASEESSYVNGQIIRVDGGL